MLKRFDSISGDPVALVNKLNEILEYCSDIKIHTTIPAVGPLNQPVIVSFIEIQFSDQQQYDTFIEKLHPKK